MTKLDLYNQIKTAFNLDDQHAQAACVLLEARAAALDYTLGQYIQRYHPNGVAERDETLPETFSGYIQFLKNDAAAVLRAGRGADFSVFVHECAHAFRRQLTGELRQQAEAAFKIENGVWNEAQEELFARGLEQWIKRRHGRDKTRANIYNKGKQFVDNVYRGMEYIVHIDQKMEAVYEKLFESDGYKFDQNKYESLLSQTAAGKMLKASHVVLGVTPRIYEMLGFERLPMAITSKHLYTTLRENGVFNNVHYHNLGEDILRQAPKSLKKPLAIVQSATDMTEIISIVELKDKNNNPVIIPIAQRQKGNFNGAEIDINLVKTIFGKNGFEYWIRNAAQEARLLYMDKRKTEPALNGKLTHAFQNRSITASNHTDYHHQDVSGFYIDSIARYREAVKSKFPERFVKGISRLYYQKPKLAHGQLLFNFDAHERVSAIENKAVSAITDVNIDNTRKPPKRKPRDFERDGFSF